MSNTKTIKPTESELEILQTLWTRGLATVREVHEDLARTKDVGYTTTLKLMQIMHEKGLVKRDEKEKAHIYRPAQTQRQTQKSLVGDLLDKAFSGSALKLVQHVLETTPSSAEELAQIRKLITEAEARGGKQ